MLTLPKLICKAREVTLELGGIAGTCVFCGCDTDRGYPNTLISSNFTAGDRLGGGDVVCPECWYVYNEPTYRKRAWVVTDSTFTEVKRENAKELLLNPPDPPFVIYLTQSWKKQGFVNLINRVQESKSNYTLGLDYDLIEVNTSKLEEYCDLITELLEKKIMKTELQTGQLKAKSYEKLGYDMELIERIKVLVGNPLWNLAIFVS